MLGLVLQDQRAQLCEHCRQLVMHFAVHYSEKCTGQQCVQWYPVGHSAPCGGVCVRGESSTRIDCALTPGGGVLFFDTKTRLEVKVHLSPDCSACAALRTTKRASAHIPEEASP